MPRNLRGDANCQVKKVAFAHCPKYPFPPLQASMFSLQRRNLDTITRKKNKQNLEEKQKKKSISLKSIYYFSLVACTVLTVLIPLLPILFGSEFSWKCANNVDISNILYSSVFFGAIVPLVPCHDYLVARDGIRPDRRHIKPEQYLSTASRLIGVSEELSKFSQKYSVRRGALVKASFPSLPVGALSFEGKILSSTQYTTNTAIFPLYKTIGKFMSISNRIQVPDSHFFSRNFDFKPSFYMFDLIEDGPVLYVLTSNQRIKFANKNDRRVVPEFEDLLKEPGTYLFRFQDLYIYISCAKVGFIYQVSYNWRRLQFANFTLKKSCFIYADGVVFDFPAMSSEYFQQILNGEKSLLLRSSSQNLRVTRASSVIKLLNCQLLRIHQEEDLCTALFFQGIDVCASVKHFSISDVEYNEMQSTLKFNIVSTEDEAYSGEITLYTIYPEEYNDFLLIHKCVKYSNTNFYLFAENALVVGENAEFRLIYLIHQSRANIMLFRRMEDT